MTKLKKYGVLAGALTAIFILAGQVFGFWGKTYTFFVNAITHEERMEKLERDTVKRYWRERRIDRSLRELDSLMKLKK